MAVRRAPLALSACPGKLARLGTRQGQGSHARAPSDSYQLAPLGWLGWGNGDREKGKGAERGKIDSAKSRYPVADCTYRNTLRIFHRSSPIDTSATVLPSWRSRPQTQPSVLDGRYGQEDATTRAFGTPIPEWLLDMPSEKGQV